MTRIQLNLGPPLAGTVTGARTAQTPTFTPAVWVILWVCMTAGYIVGFADAAAMADSTAMSYILDFYMQLSARWAVSGASSSSALLVERPCQYPAICWCDASQTAQSWFLATRMLATAVAALPGAWLSRMAGRRVTLLTGTCLMLVGLTLQATAFHWGQLLAGVLPLGLGMSLVLQSVWIECAEIAPPKWRASLLACFTLSRSCGMWVSLVCMRAVDTAQVQNGWRAVIALGGWPTLMLLLLTILMPETPNSLIQRGRLAEGRDALTIIRGPFYDCNKELLDIWKSAGRPSSVLDSKINLMIDNFRQLRQREHLPPFLVAVLIALFMETTGIYHLLGHALAPMMGIISPNQSTLKGAATIGASATVGALLSVSACIKLSPRTLISFGTITVAACWLILGLQITYAPATGLTFISASIGLAVFAINVAASTGGLNTLFPIVVTENQPLTTRAHAVAIAIAINYLMRAVITVFRGSMICSMQEVSFFTAMVGNTCVAVITLLLLPSTKHLPLELVHTAWAQHWLWKRFYTDTAAQSPRSLDQRHEPGLAFASSSETAAFVSGSTTQEHQQLTWKGSGLGLVGSGNRRELPES